MQRPGFFRALQYVLRVTENGLMHGGPPCSSFVWVNRATSGRGRDQPDGRDGVKSVFTANKPFGVCSIFLRVSLSNSWHNFQIINVLCWMLWIFQPRITARFTLLVMLCVCRCLYVVIEQPRSSLMPLLTPMRWLQKALKKLGIKWFQKGLILFLMRLFCKVIWGFLCEAPQHSGILLFSATDIPC